MTLSCMYEAKFEVEAVTPIFMRGADQSQAEIRSSSIKGLMRWWFRALAGNYFGNDIAGLKKVEDYVFGSTGGRSRVVVEVSNHINSKRKSIKTNEYERYFWFSAVGKYSQQYLPPKETFTVTIKSFEKECLELALSSFWILARLGGIGFRSRKFAGSIDVNKVLKLDSEIPVSFTVSGDPKKYYKHSLPKLLEFFNDRIKSLAEKLKLDRPLQPNDVPKYPTISPDWCNIYVGSIHGTSDEAIIEVGRWYLGKQKGRKFEGGFRFRRYNRRILNIIYNNYKKSGKINIQKNIPMNKEKRPYLGLPIQFYKKFKEDEFIRFTVDYLDYEKRVSFKRRASSLIFTVKKRSNEDDEKYFPIITVFKYLFLPSFNGSVHYSGSIKDHKKTIPVSGLIFIAPKGVNPQEDFSEFYDFLIDDLDKNFTQVYP